MADPRETRYDESSIKHLPGLEAVRMRPGMYVGGTDLRALHHLVYEVVDNSIDEAMAGYASEVSVTIHEDGSVTVSDNGRGIPVGLHESGVSTLTLVMTELHAGGKFDDGAYKVSGGLHGVGVSAVNALSERVTVNVHRNGKIWEQSFERGIPMTGVEEVGDTEYSGTITTFKPDPEIFPDTTINFDTLMTRFREMAFVTNGVMIHLRDERVEPFPKEMSFYFEGGITSFVKYINRNREPLHDPIYASRSYEVEELDGAEVEVEVAIQYADYFSTTEKAFANTINTYDGGTHLEGLRSAVTRAINFQARKAGALKDKDPNFTGDDTREGLTVVVSIKHPDPQFESQTKVKLMNPEVKGLVQSLVNEMLGEWLQTDTRAARAIYEKCLVSARARIASKRARDLIRSSPLQSTTLPGKLADCSSSANPEDTELYIVEGDSAGGCFSGDTQVALADGRHLSFEEIVAEQAEGKEHFCYTIRHDGTIGLERVINARVTKRDTEVIRVTLDNGEVITCTPDHRFMLRDGSYKQAADLTPDDSLMPLYRKTDTVWCPGRNEWLARADLAEAVSAPAAPANHRIVSIETVEERMDVYDIEVPGTHNFALASGVFVHNSAKQGRDRHFQAILPLRGKILNTERARLDRVLKNREIQALISALGVGIGDEFDLSRLRYGRIIIMTDADVDGAHIRTLLLTFFFRYMPQLIEGGHLYIAQPPLYLITQGRSKEYVYTEAQREELIKEIKGKNYSLQRYKGLGEMNPDQLWDTTMDPANRILLEVSIEDATTADQTFDMLMGSSVPPRRKFIQTHAHQVRNLDI